MPRQSRVLIVDDHPTNVNILKKLLGKEFALATAATGLAALEVAQGFRPELVLLDIMMPGIDGYETCRRMRAHVELRWSKIIMVSAKAMTAERLAGYQAGADDYLTKPFDPDELLAKVRVHLRLKSAEEVNQLKTNFLYLLRSETRNPLSALIGPAQLLMQDGAMAPAERQELAALVLQGATRLKRLFDKVQLLAMLKAGQMEFRTEPVDFCAMIREAVATVTPQATAKSVTVTTNLREPTVVDLDRALMTSVVGPMLDNAVRHAREGTAIAVTVDRDERLTRMTVCNQGTSIDPAALPHTFDELAAHPKSDRVDGHGLSLAIARHIVRGHGGEITVTSSGEAGTTFTVEVPLWQTQPTAKPVPAAV